MDRQTDKRKVRQKDETDRNTVLHFFPLNDVTAMMFVAFHVYK